MISCQDDNLIVVVIGRDADNPEKEILIGVGPLIDKEGRETNKLFLRIQRGKDDSNPIRATLNISQSTIYFEALRETIENAKMIEQSILRSAVKKK